MIRYLVLAFCLWGCAAAVVQDIPEYPPPTVMCKEQFGITICHVPGRRVPVWDLHCETGGNFHYPMCIPTLREV